MYNDSSSLLSNTLTTLDAIPGWLWGIISIAALIVAIYAIRDARISAKKTLEATEKIPDIIKDSNKEFKRTLEICLGNAVQNPGKEQQCLHKLGFNKNEIEENVKILLESSSNYEKGLGKWEKNDLDGAEWEFGTAISIYQKPHPLLSMSYFQRGNIRSLQRKFKEACVDYSAAIEINPQYAEAWYNKGTALGKLGKHDDAIKAYDKAIEINPQFAEAWNNKGTALSELGKHDDAIKAFDKTIEINPQYAEAWNNKGTALSELGKHDDAIKAFDKAIEINPQYADAWYNKGTALGELGKHDDAIKAFDKAIEINPQYAKAWYNKGNALVKLGKHDDAIKAFDKNRDRSSICRCMVQQRQCSR
ncbi:MAG: tetratricopeptide repeat protein [Methanotrichaceae archaeon]